MKEQIEETLQCLIGQRFWGAKRRFGLLVLHFGPQKMTTDQHGNPHEVGTYAIHSQCAWRITAAKSIRVASGDISFGTTEEYNEEKAKHGEDAYYPLAKGNKNRQHEQLSLFFEHCAKTPIFVQSILADDFGGLTIEMSEDYKLALFPNDSLEGEFWRFFILDDEVTPHLVVTGNGIEDQTEDPEE
jgi:hypothetical protein